MSEVEDEGPGPERPTRVDEGRRIAAVDLGSNSFHMVIGRVVGGQPVIEDRLREQVQLAAGLDEERRLTPEACERALACLARFGQRLRSLPAESARAVGTNTLRVARNAREFLAAAEGALGHEIEIVPGREEARLIYLGVAHDLADDFGPRLVVDIGGGSTECILGERFEAIETHSLYMGCVGFSRRFFPSGRIDKDSMERAVLAGRLELQPLERLFQETGWEQAVGSSGTIRTVDAVLRAQGWSEGGITRAGLRRLRKALVAAGSIETLALEGLKPERAPVFPGGVAILSAVFEALEIEHMGVSFGALREGLLYDLLGRIRHEDVRERTIRNLQVRYQVDREQALRVERTALELLRAVAAPWQLTGEEPARFLSWAAHLHELGLALSYRHYHRHGAYVLANSDLPGFSRDDQVLLACLVSEQRRRVRTEAFDLVPARDRPAALKLAALLRLAVLLNRPRAQGAARIRVTGSPGGLHVTPREGWFEEYPLTRVDLEAEVIHLAALGIRLELNGAGAT